VSEWGTTSKIKNNVTRPWQRVKATKPVLFFVYSNVLTLVGDVRKAFVKGLRLSFHLPFSYVRNKANKTYNVA
jgi:hypothetical protein